MAYKMYSWLWLWPLLVTLAGCASVQPPATRSADSQITAPALAQDPHDGRRWWRAQFQFRWPEDAARPEWALDALLADRVCRPALAARRQQIAFWRFHRRAARDAAGHRFSLIFYARSPTAQAVYAALAADPLIRSLLANGQLQRVSFSRPAPTGADTQQLLEATSDASWAPVVQRAWPAFIMGVSETWLSLLGQVAADLPAGLDPHRPEPLLDAYRQVNETVDVIWRQHGQHAFLHHLNAVFGYRPLAIRY